MDALAQFTKLAINGQSSFSVSWALPHGWDGHVRESGSSSRLCSAVWSLALHPQSFCGAQLLCWLSGHKNLTSKCGYEDRVKLLTPLSILASFLENSALQNICNKLWSHYRLGEPPRWASAARHIYPSTRKVGGWVWFLALGLTGNKTILTWKVMLAISSIDEGWIKAKGSLLSLSYHGIFTKQSRAVHSGLFVLIKKVNTMQHSFSESVFWF